MRLNIPPMTHHMKRRIFYNTFVLHLYLAISRTLVMLSGLDNSDDNKRARFNRPHFVDLEETLCA